MLALSAATPTTAFTCRVTRVHDGDGPLWCSNGIKVRIAGVQAPDFESASPCRAADPRRMNYRCDNAAARRSRRPSSASCYARRSDAKRLARAMPVSSLGARCRTADRCRVRRSRPAPPYGGIDTGDSTGWASAGSIFGAAYSSSRRRHRSNCTVLVNCASCATAIFGTSIACDKRRDDRILGGGTAIPPVKAGRSTYLNHCPRILLDAKSRKQYQSLGVLKYSHYQTMSVKNPQLPV